VCNNGLCVFACEEVPLGIFFVFRALVGAVSFFFVSWALDGHPYYITPKAAPFTLGWMALYVGEKRERRNIHHDACVCASLVAACVAAFVRVACCCVCGLRVLLRAV
jgi:hypothetical protein